MKKIFYFLLVVCLVSGCATFFKFNRSSTLKPYSTSKLENGLNILYVSDEKLPYISLSLVVLSGYASDPKDQTGLTSAALELLNKGTQNKTAIQIASEIEQMGAEYGASVSEDYSMINLEGLSWQEDKMFEIFSELILKPKYDTKEIDRYKSRMLALVQQRLDQISYFASEIFDKFYYVGHPYSQRDVGSVEHIKKLTRNSILTHYSNIVRPNNSWLVVVGKYSNGVEEKLEKYFGAWKNQPVPQKEFPLVKPIKGRQILLVNKPDAAQAEIRIGHKGTERTASDHMATNIANSILGQGFTSRLVDRIRDQLGLTYSISSGIEFQLHGSVFEIHTFTQSPKVGQTISEIYKVYEEFNKSGVTQKEVNIAQNYMAGVFPSLVETAEKTAYNLMILRIFGVSDDYLLNYQKNVFKTTLEEVNASIKKNFHPDNLKIVVVAPKEKVLDQIKNLGTVEVVEAKSFLK